MESRLIGIVIALVIAAAAVGYRFTQRDSEGEDMREQVMTHLQSLPDFDTHGSLYCEWFEAHHEDVFNRHYHIGGRRSRSWFDGDAYLEDLFIAMGTEAAAAGYQLQAEQLQELGDSLYME